MVVTPAGGWVGPPWYWLYSWFITRRLLTDGDEDGRLEDKEKSKEGKPFPSEKIGFILQISVTKKKLAPSFNVKSIKWRSSPKARPSGQGTFPDLISKWTSVAEVKG